MYCLSQNETCVRTDNFSHVCYFLVLVKIIKTGLVCCNDVPAAFIIMFQEHGGIVHTDINHRRLSQRAAMKAQSNICSFFWPTDE